MLGDRVLRGLRVGDVERDDYTPGMVAELLEAFRTSDRLFKLCLSPPSPHRFQISLETVENRIRMTQNMEAPGGGGRVYLCPLFIECWEWYSALRASLAGRLVGWLGLYHI